MTKRTCGDCQLCAPQIPIYAFPANRRQVTDNEPNQPGYVPGARQRSVEEGAP
jgi:hypothetical protein